jgi:hypothetical protein
MCVNEGTENCVMGGQVLNVSYHPARKVSSNKYALYMHGNSVIYIVERLV